MGMVVRPWSNTLYNQLVDHFRRGGTLTDAEVACSCSGRSAKRAFYGPSTEVGGWDRPIKEILRQEAVIAMPAPGAESIPPPAMTSVALERFVVQQNAAKELELELARLANIQQIAKERATVFKMNDELAAYINSVSGFGPAVDVVKHKLNHLVMHACTLEPGEPGAMTINQGMAFLRDLSGLWKGLFGAAEIGQKMSRLNRGQSTENVAIQGKLEMDLTSAMEILEHARGPAAARRAVAEVDAEEGDDGDGAGPDPEE